MLKTVDISAAKRTVPFAERTKVMMLMRRRSSFDPEGKEITLDGYTTIFPLDAEVERAAFTYRVKKQCSQLATPLPIP